jgi:hypothetical protein
MPIVQGTLMIDSHGCILWESILSGNL